LEDLIRDVNRMIRSSEYMFMYTAKLLRALEKALLESKRQVVCTGIPNQTGSTVDEDLKTLFGEDDDINLERDSSHNLNGHATNEAVQSGSTDKRKRSGSSGGDEESLLSIEGTGIPISRLRRTGNKLRRLSEELERSVLWEQYRPPEVKLRRRLDHAGLFTLKLTEMYHPRIAGVTIPPPSGDVGGLLVVEVTELLISDCAGDCWKQVSEIARNLLQ